MKRILIAFSILVSTAVQAQTEKGTLLLGGDISFTSIENTSMFQASPNIGFFAANNFAVGGQFNFFTSEGFSSWSVGPFGRYYFGKNTSGKPFVGAGVNIGGADDSDTELGYGAHAGYALFLNKSVALEFGVNYNHTDDIDMIGVGVGFQIHFKK